MKKIFIQQAFLSMLLSKPSKYVLISSSSWKLPILARISSVKLYLTPEMQIVQTYYKKSFCGKTFPQIDNLTKEN